MRSLSVNEILNVNSSGGKGQTRAIGKLWKSRGNNRGEESKEEGEMPNLPGQGFSPRGILAPRYWNRAQDAQGDH